MELKEVIYEDEKLHLVFEYCEYDIKKYMKEKAKQNGNKPLDVNDVKVSPVTSSPSRSKSCRGSRTATPTESCTEI